MSSQSPSPTKKTVVQTKINGFFTSTPPEVKTKKDKGHRKDRTSRRSKKRRRSTPPTPTRSPSPHEPVQIEEIANPEEPASGGSLRKIKPFKLRIRRRIPSSSSEVDSDWHSEVVKQTQDSLAKPENEVKKNGKLKGPKSSPDAKKNGIHSNSTSDRRKTKAKVSMPADNSRTILSYFGKVSATPPARHPLIVVGEVSSSVILDSDEEVIDVKTASRQGRRLFETDTLKVSPTKSEVSVSSFEFEKEERLGTLESPITCENDEEGSEPDCESDTSVHVLSADEDRKEGEEENTPTSARSLRKRPRLTTPKSKSIPRKTWRVSRITRNSDPSSPSTSEIKQSDDSASGTPTTSSQTPLDTGRRRSSRIQKLQLERLDLDCKDDLTPSPVPVTVRKKRGKKYENDSASAEEDIDQSSSSATSGSDEDEYFVKKPKKKKNAYPLASIFLSKKEREEELRKLKEEKEPKKVMSQELIDFLRSGVPDEIAKAQKNIEKRKLELELEDALQFFPTFSHNVEPREFYEIDWEKSTFPLRTSGVEEIVHKQGLSKCTMETESLSFIDSGRFCCGADTGTGISKKFLHILTKKQKTDSESDQLPWVDKYRVGRRNDLVIDKVALHKFEKWLRQWRSDIKDDGGTSRKTVEKKKKKRESDSDFVTDEEAEDEFLKKSVVLVGPTGCGKTAMVYVLAKQIGFTVVEVSFSSRRSGKDVLQSVEEATLSRRISDKAEVDDKHCLLLFKDIDQLHLEDEGFHAAVAQLITASCRPIVMTICSTSFCVIDPKIHKKDPLWIYFQPPPPTAIVNKLLLPIVEAELERLDRNFELDSYKKDKRSVVGLLNSLVRHSDCDIRKSLNQMQVLWSSKNSFNFKTIHRTLSPSLDLDFIHSPAGQKEATDKPSSEDLPKSKTKCEKLAEIREMDQLAKTLEHITDFERCRSMLDELADDTEPIPVSHRILPYFDIRFRSSSFEFETHDKNESLLDISRSLTFQTDESSVNYSRSTELYDELTSYVDQFNNYDAIAYVRTIVKNSVLRSVGSEAKRNGRIKPYFNCLGRDFIDRICNNLGFPDEVATMKLKYGLDHRSARR